MYYSEAPVKTTTSSLESLSMWMVISIAIAVICGLVIYFCFLTKENEGKLTGKEKWLYDFLNFKNLYSEVLLKIAYCITVVYLIIFSCSFISSNFLEFILVFVIGNVAARIMYEFAIAFLRIYENTTEINSKMKNSKEPKVEAKEIKETKKENK